MQTSAGTIVVGVDGSDSARHALAWAVAQAVAERRPLTLAHAIHAVTPAYVDMAIVYPSDAGAVLTAEGQKVLDAAHRQVAAAAPDLEVHEVLELRDPRETLLELSHDAALMVLGSRGRGPIRSLLLGSVGVALVRHASCPVVVHRPSNPGVVRHGVLVGVEASEDSQPVMELAYREAALRDLPLTVVHCYQDIRLGSASAGLVPEPLGDLESERADLSEAMAGMTEKYPEVLVTTQLAEGHPAEVLSRLGERMNLVVVGAHRTGPHARTVLGSVSVALVEHATCPVAVVPVGTA